MRKKIIAGNWKMNTSLSEAVSLAKAISAGAQSFNNVQLVVCPPFTWIIPVCEALSNTSISVGAQNCAAEEKGAFTGEVSAPMLVSAGVGYVLVGHSERRAIFGETDAVINLKVKQALAQGLTVIFCCGESLDERNDGKLKQVISGQLSNGLFEVTLADMKRIIIAYEPVWAIGTGLTATPEQAQEVHVFLRAQLQQLYDGETATSTSVLYGGSCNPSNAASLFEQPDIDGGLIGGASLKATDFLAIAAAL